VKKLFFLSTLCSLVLFTHCGEDEDDSFILDKLNGYYFPTNDSRSILEFEDSKLFWSVLTDSCRYNIMNSLTLDTITNHTSTEYSGVYQVSGWDEGKNDVTALLKAFPDFKTYMQIRGIFGPDYFKSKKLHLRLTVTSFGSGVNFIIETGYVNSLDSCFYGMNDDLMIGNNGDCTTIDPSWSTQFINDNSQSTIDDIIQSQECN